MAWQHGADARRRAAVPFRRSAQPERTTLPGGRPAPGRAGILHRAQSILVRVPPGHSQNEQRAELLGFDIRWRKTAIFTFAGAIAGLAGGLFAAWGNFINPEVFSLPQAALVVIWVLVGGRGTLYGAVLGAVAVQLLSSYLGSAGSTYTTLLLGSALLVIVLFFKEGLPPALWRPIQRAVLNRRPNASS